MSYYRTNSIEKQNKKTKCAHFCTLCEFWIIPVVGHLCPITGIKRIYFLHLDPFKFLTLAYSQPRFFTMSKMALFDT